VTKSHEEVEKLALENMLCINGDILERIILQFENPSNTVQHMHIFSRTSPTHKAIIVGMIN